MMFVILLMIVAVAAFNIVATLVMIVKEKQTDIAILRTLGAGPSNVLLTFAVQGVLIGLAGTLLGAARGTLLADSLQSLAGVLAARGVHRSSRQGPLLLPGRQRVALTVSAAERAAIVGASASGKTTLLHIRGGRDRPTAGAVLIAGRDIHSLAQSERGTLRNRALGFVYQFHHLLPEFSALENVAMPLLVRRTRIASARAEARRLLERVGLGERLAHRPHQLSGGERQRAAVARALVTP